LSKGLSYQQLFMMCKRERRRREPLTRDSGEKQTKNWGWWSPFPLILPKLFLSSLFIKNRYSSLSEWCPLLITCTWVSPFPSCYRKPRYSSRCRWFILHPLFSSKTVLKDL
jgi:hypothetical protein